MATKMHGLAQLLTNLPVSHADENVARVTLGMLALSKSLAVV
jgi:hypothetical protein